MCLKSHYIILQALNGRKDYCLVNFKLPDNADGKIISEINHPCGCLLWETINDNLDNVLNGKGEKSKNARLTNSKHKIGKYNVYAFISRVQLH